MWSRGQWIGPTCVCGVCVSSETRRAYGENVARRKTASGRWLQWDKLGVRPRIITVCHISSRCSLHLSSHYVTVLHDALASVYGSTLRFFMLQCPVIIFRHVCARCSALLSHFVTFLHAAVSCYRSTSHFCTLECPVIIIRHISARCSVLLLSHYIYPRCNILL
jgi:hypothetical protein